MSVVKREHIEYLADRSRELLSRPFGLVIIAAADLPADLVRSAAERDRGSADRSIVRSFVRWLVRSIDRSTDRDDRVSEAGPEDYQESVARRGAA